MSKILKIYENEVERVWYDSSNVFYSECDDGDKSDKTVRVTFKDGRTYEYEDVNVFDYVAFRNADSQGKVLNSTLKQYKVQRIENKDITALSEELEGRLKPVDIEDEKVESQYYVVINEDDFNILKDDNIVKTISLNNSVINVIKEFCGTIEIPIK